MEKSAEKNHYLYGLGLTVLFFTLLHLFFKKAFSDDASFLAMANNSDSLFLLMKERYETYSSRILTEILTFTLLKLPFVIFCILDILVCALLYHSLSVMLFTDRKDPLHYILFFAIAAYPFMHMASAGWHSTTLNYLWPFTAICYPLSGAFRRLRGEKIPAPRYILYFMSLIFAVNCEMPSAMTLLVFLGVIVWIFLISRFVEKPENAPDTISVKPVFEIAAIVLAVGGIIFAFTCPGNAIRSEIELRWLPEFPELSFFARLRLCSIFVFEHFVYIPDLLFLTFSIVLLFIGIKKEHSLLRNIIAAIPTAIALLFTGGYFIVNFILGDLRAYDFPTPAIYIEDTATAVLQYGEFAALILYIAAVIYTLIVALPEVKERFSCIWALGSGFAVREALLLSPTMFASWHRTLIYFYFAMIYCIVTCYRHLDKKWMQRASRILLYLGIIVNLILTIGHQLRR